ncbi:type II toxin-antitoxin system RelE/ParE family toxin [Paludisphaera mucosa]|uniref:Type II toxin-antitoxin system RelE/ParE family toxin n=1 Tax=Paludisphaera mucosa TaxID=3030827 RepID=A0ABT6FKK6_9BACT|nr:type II toxin-antitoxin system RelE/ParE family toxin [Paludisphaera mucosa]MDG3008108.1 type II toxin-antitoxin system RelE/ParE family toxin [Paludisphaera mucosa]
MTRSHRVAPAADRDIDDQAAYLMEEADIDLALRFLAAADVAFARIAPMPGMGRRWESVDPRPADLRIWRIKGFRNHPAFIVSPTTSSRSSACCTPPAAWARCSNPEPSSPIDA